MNRIMDFQIGLSKHYLKAGVELVHMGDDMGTQQGPLFSPEIRDEFLVPEYRRLFDIYKEAGVMVDFHSCGNIEHFLETFMDLGVTVLNSVQVTANNLDAVRSVTQGRMVLRGAVNSDTLVNGPKEKIAAEVRERLWQMGRDGGYFCHQDQGMPWAQEHYDVMIATVEEYGIYPISQP